MNVGESNLLGRVIKALARLEDKSAIKPLQVRLKNEKNEEIQFLLKTVIKILKDI